MTFVSRLAPSIKVSSLDDKYVKQTYDAMSNNNLNLESIAVQLAQMPVREQKRFFRLFLNYTDVTAERSRFAITSPAMREVVELSERIIELVNNYYEEQDQMQLALEGM